MADLRYPSRKLTLCDVLIVVLILLAAVFSAYFLFSRDAGASCTVSFGQESATFSLADDRVIPVRSNGYALTVVIEKGTVSVTESDCPDGICLNSGAVSRKGQAIVCVPAGVIVRIDGARTDDADMIAGGAP